MGLRDTDAFEYLECQVEDDVWLGHNSVLTAGARRVGRGAVVAAGAIVTRDVEPYAVVAGAPARVVKYRFDRAVIAKIEDSRWWEWDLVELRRRAQETPQLVYDPAAFFAGK